MATLECWFDFASNYSYLAVMRLEAEAARAGVAVAWRPFLLGPLFQAFGWDNSPFVLQPEKGAWVFAQDMPRQCRRLGLPWQRPSRFPRSSVLPARVALLVAAEPWAGAFCRRLMAMNFAEDREIDTPEAVAEALRALGQPAEALIAQALSPTQRPRLRAQTEAARARGLFGAPSFLVGDQLFWGNDRLEEALACAAAC